MCCVLCRNANASTSARNASHPWSTDDETADATAGWVYSAAAVRPAAINPLPFTGPEPHGIRAETERRSSGQELGVISNLDR